MPTTTKPKPCELPCAKCGSTDVNRHFYARGEDIDLDLCQWEARAKGKFVDADNVAKHDHIEHHCRCCSHEWRTSPLKT